MSRNPELFVFNELRMLHPLLRAIRIEWLTRPWYLGSHWFFSSFDFTNNALLFFALISSATFILKKKIILPLIWTELGEKTLPLRRSTRLNTVIKMNQAYIALQSRQWHISYASRFRFALGERIVLRHRVKDCVTSSRKLWTTQHTWVHVKSLSRKFRILEF